MCLRCRRSFKRVPLLKSLAAYKTPIQVRVVIGLNSDWILTNNAIL